jgi:hypothetical protein
MAGNARRIGLSAYSGESLFSAMKMRMASTSNKDGLRPLWIIA